MGSAEKVLEGHLLDVGNKILAPSSSVEELLTLLDQAETFLSRVEQSPSQSMITALHPAMNGLTANELLGHSDIDVKVAVASCISEITRITAPEAPYEDDLMKEVFEMIVEAFKKLDDMSSRSYFKRVSILETVAKVRSCVVMLDLECDSLILEMFHHFLNTIRDNHPANVFSSMEMIMTLVLEESEDISLDLLSCLLMSVKDNNKDILPISRKLAEKVIGNCASKLKPSLMEAVQSMGASLNDYSKIVASVCQGSSDVLEQNSVNVSGEGLAGESKMSDGIFSDEKPQVSQKVEPDVACPKVSAAADNGTVKTGDDSSLVEPTSPHKKGDHSFCSMLPKNATAARLESKKLDTALDHVIKKGRRQKSNSAVQPMENTDHSQLEAVELPNRRKGCGREINTVQSRGASEQETEATKMEDKEQTTGHHVPSEKPTDNSGSVISAADNENVPDSRRPKRGRSSTKKVGTSPAGDVPILLSGSKKFPVNGNIEDEAVPSMDVGLKKQIESTSGSEKKLLRRSVKKGNLVNVDNGGKSSANSHSDMAVDLTADPEEKLQRRPGRKSQAKKASEAETSEKRLASKSKQQKGRVSLESMVVGEPNQKGMISSPKTPPITKANRDHNLSEEGLKTKSRKKRAREEVVETPRDAIKYDESLVGVKIRVWWPDDEQFYPGVIDSYDPATMRHKVLYADGDEEVLLLEDETIELLGREEEGKNISTSESAEMPRKKARKSDSSVKKMKLSSSRSGGSVGKVNGDRRKPGGKRGSAESPGGRKVGSAKTDDSTPTGNISKEKKGRRHNLDMPKSNILSEDGSPRAATKTKDRIAKAGKKSKSDTRRAGSGLKGDASKIGSAKNQTSTPGSKAKDDASGTGSKLKSKNVSPGKSRSKSDANGSAKVKNGSSKQLETEHTVTKANSNARLSQESEETSRKKCRKKSQS